MAELHTSKLRCFGGLMQCQRGRIVAGQHLHHTVKITCADFALMANRQYSHKVALGKKPVERDVPGPAARDHQLTHAFFRGSAYEWMAPQYGNCLEDRPDRLIRELRILREEKVEKPV